MFANTATDQVLVVISRNKPKFIIIRISFLDTRSALFSVLSSVSVW